MIKRTLIWLVIFVLILAAFYVSTVDYRSSIFASWQPCFGGSTSAPPPLKVYMYDLPRRFNVGMLSHKDDENDSSPVTAENLPRWPEKSGLRKQHSVEYWMMASLLYNGRNDHSSSGGGETDSGQEAVRVLDPDMADVFFVPFFSSLSFNTHGKDMRDPDTKFDEQLQVDILNILRNSKYWQRSAGRDHVIPLNHPNAFRFHRDGVTDSIQLVADFGRTFKNQSNLSKDIVAPYVHVVDSFLDDNSSDPYESRPMLLYFRGRIDRKDEGTVRKALKRELDGNEGVLFEEGRATEEGVQASINAMRTSKFCLHPAGDTPSSCRLFDAIVSHCIPVIVSDNIELPYEDELDYTEFSIFISDKEAVQPKYLVDTLRRISKEKWLVMWRRLKNVSHHFEYQYPPKKEDAVNMIWRQVRNKLPAAKLAIHRSRRLKVPDWWR